MFFLRSAIVLGHNGFVSARSAAANRHTSAPTTTANWRAEGAGIARIVSSDCSGVVIDACRAPSFIAGRVPGGRVPGGRVADNLVGRVVVVDYSRIRDVGDGFAALRLRASCIITSARAQDVLAGSGGRRAIQCRWIAGYSLAVCGAQRLVFVTQSSAMDRIVPQRRQRHGLRPRNRYSVEAAVHDGIGVDPASVPIVGGPQGRSDQDRGAEPDDAYSDVSGRGPVEGAIVRIAPSPVHHV